MGSPWRVYTVLWNRRVSRAHPQRRVTIYPTGYTGTIWVKLLGEGRPLNPRTWYNWRVLSEITVLQSGRAVGTATWASRRRNHSFFDLVVQRTTAGDQAIHMNGLFFVSFDILHNDDDGGFEFDNTPRARP